MHGPESKHDVTFIMQQDFGLRRIIMTGGAKLLCQLWDKDVAEYRKNIQQAFEHLLKTDLVFCAEKDVEFHIWKIAFYSIVEVLKLSLKEESPEVRNLVHNNILELLDEGMDFYAQMLETLDATYKLDLDTFYDVLEPRPSDKHTRCALMSAQKCLLCLGDLARYKETILETSNFGKARQFYQKASNIETRNGRPFNQLALLALTTKRKFEAVYYNMRCLQSKNPFPASQESLTVTLDEIKKKWEAGEKKRLEEKEMRRKAMEREKEGKTSVRGTRLRKEIWVRPGGGKRLHRTTSASEVDNNNDSEEAELRELSVTDLNRRFINTFLYLIGKLFTHINMETFPLALEVLGREFRVLVSRSPLPIDSKRLVQIMALNMFVIEHTKMKSGDSERYRSAMQDSALQLAFEMFGILVERCNVLLANFRPEIDSGSQCIFPDEDLPSLLSAVKVWCDWMLGNNDTWYPIVSEEPFTQFARLATHLEKLKPLMKPVLVQFYTEEKYLALPSSERRPNFELVKLQEDALLCGFNPWFRGLDWAVYRRYAPRSVPSPLVQDARRLDAINFCVEYLEGLEPPILKWSFQEHAHISLVDTTKGDKSDVRHPLTTALTTKDQDILEESYSDDEPSTSTPASGPYSADDKISKLKLRKDELERRRAEEEREARRIQQRILSEHVNVTLEICPRYVVPDTNCFVDFLNDIRKLSQSNAFHLRVPLIVLNELDGLAKGAKFPASKEHSAMVTENARKALNFLRDRPANLKCITSKGTVLSSLGVTTEEDCADADKKNDDLILDACLNLCSPGSETTEGQMRLVRREVVLLTEDRNLKLKAHLTDIPVNKIPDFMKWAFPPPAMSGPN